MTGSNARTPWSHVERDTLAQMWLCGCRSPRIAETLGRSRSAVMGRIGKDGLMGRRATGVAGSHLPMAALRRLVDDTMRDLLGRARRRGAADDVCAVMVAMAAVGRDAALIDAAARTDQTVVESVRRALGETGAWPEREGPPPQWWTVGAPAFMETAWLVVRRIAGAAPAAAA